MSSQAPFLIYGHVKKNGVDQAGISVTVKDETNNESSVVVTNVNGFYAIDLGDITRYPSGYGITDNIKASCTVEGAYIYKTTTVSTALMGRELHLLLTTKEIDDQGSGVDDVSLTKPVQVDDIGSGTESLILDKMFTIEDVGQGADEITLTISGGNVVINDLGQGIDVIEQVRAFIERNDFGNGIDEVTVVGVTEKEIAEYGVGIDEVIVLPAIIQISDYGMGQDAILIDKPVDVSDFGSGAEEIVLEKGLGDKVIEDVGQGLDSIAIDKAVDILDVGQGLDEVIVSTASFPFSMAMEEISPITMEMEEIALINMKMEEVIA